MHKPEVTLILSKGNDNQLSKGDFCSLNALVTFIPLGQRTILFSIHTRGTTPSSTSSSIQTALAHDMLTPAEKTKGTLRHLSLTNKHLVHLTTSALCTMYAWSFS